MNFFSKILIILIFFIITIVGFSQEIKPLSSIDEVSALMSASKGKIILVNFWATWCVPCVKEFPDLIKLYDNYKDSNFVLIFISVDDNKDIESEVKPFLKKNNVRFLSYYNNFRKIEDLVNYFDPEWQGAIPSTFIFNKDGKITANFIGKKRYEDFENEIIKNLN